MRRSRDSNSGVVSGQARRLSCRATASLGSASHSLAVAPPEPTTCRRSRTALNARSDGHGIQRRPAIEDAANVTRRLFRACAFPWIANAMPAPRSAHSASPRFFAIPAERRPDPAGRRRARAACVCISPYGILGHGNFPGQAKPGRKRGAMPVPDRKNVRREGVIRAAFRRPDSGTRERSGKRAEGRLFRHGQTWTNPPARFDPPPFTMLKSRLLSGFAGRLAQW